MPTDDALQNIDDLRATPGEMMTLIDESFSWIFVEVDVEGGFEAVLITSDEEGAIQLVHFAERVYTADDKDDYIHLSGLIDQKAREDRFVWRYKQ